MSPEAEDCERGGGRGGRVQPAGAGGARAWAEREHGPPETRLLLAPVHSPPAHRPPPPPPPPAKHAGLTLAVQPHPKTTSEYTLGEKFQRPVLKTKFEKRKEKLVAALRPPYFILSMIAVITGVHMWGGEEVRASLEWSPSAWRREPWRLVTYGWVHASATHVALNALVGLAVGWRLEREQGWARAAAVWAGGVAAGALGAGALQPTVRVVGASAAVYALLTAHLSNVCLRFGHIPLWWFRPLSVLVLAASEASWTLLHSPPAPAPAPAPPLAPDEHEHVAWAAHVFGALVGVPLAFLVFTGERAGERYVTWCRAASLALLAAGGAAAAMFYLHCQRAAPG